MACFNAQNVSGSITVKVGVDPFRQTLEVEICDTSPFRGMDGWLFFCHLYRQAAEVAKRFNPFQKIGGRHDVAVAYQSSWPSSWFWWL